MTDHFGDRMKAYEQAECGRRIMPLLPVMVRIDGKNFSRFTKDLERPFSRALHEAFIHTTMRIVEESGALIGYTQSDEITLLLHSDTTQSQIYFDGKIQKLVSVLASIASVEFNDYWTETFDRELGERHYAYFDCRVWTVPTLEEAANTILWREMDATKNSVSMLARCHFSHKHLHGLGRADQLDLLISKGINWNDCPSAFKRGTYVQRYKVVRRFLPEELENLPPQHEAHANPDLAIERTDIRTLIMPPLGKVTNRVDWGPHCGDTGEGFLAMRRVLMEATTLGILEIRQTNDSGPEHIEIRRIPDNMNS